MSDVDRCPQSLNIILPHCLHEAAGHPQNALCCRCGMWFSHPAHGPFAVPPPEPETQPPAGGLFLGALGPAAEAVTAPAPEPQAAIVGKATVRAEPELLPELPPPEPRKKRKRSPARGAKKKAPTKPPRVLRKR